ncbi:type I polyketide synthase [Amycolatopsis sulphurea]|uniref:type I polyketide synthase n=1 Tax=Amycolatopsis sulphurea TaxID=76022 RepID=UPI001475BFF6|nr:type I polyketide synthase [Amycolatopsis sulphurea]
MSETEDKVAIIGMAGRFPGAADVGTLWGNLRAGKASLSRWTLDEVEGVPPEEYDSDHYVPVQGYLPDATLFREDLFGFSHAEAAVLDPQVRLLLQTAWEALDDAGVERSVTEPANVGVFATVGSSEHALAAQTDATLLRELGRRQVRFLTDKDYAATWISYKLGLVGPAVSVQTACSSSMVAIHQAANSVLLGECRVALAGGSAVDTPHRRGYTFYEGGIASRTGAVRPFDTSSDGAVGGHGVGMVVLKRLDDALANGDTVHAVLLGSAIGNDGRDKVGFTAPGVEGHARVIAAAWEVAGIGLDELTYFEAHGTGTRLGDPVEVAAFAQACADTNARPQAVIGSIKGNIGHLDVAAGVAAVIKAACMVRDRILVPTPGLTEPAPGLNLEGRGLRTIGETTPAEGKGPMYVGVSSVGIGGTNAHVVLGEPPARPAPAPEPGPHLLPVSAQSTSDLHRYIAALRDRIGERPLSTIAATLQTGRRTLPVRTFAVVGRPSEAFAIPSHGVSSTGKAQRTVFLFPGQTSRYDDLGSSMYQRFARYRNRLDEYAELLLDEYGIDPRPWRGEPAERDTDYWQPTLVAHQLALAELLHDHGLTPAATLGHSLGEFTAAVVRGVFEPTPILRAVAERGRLMRATPLGAMISINTDATTAAALCHDGISLAAVNSEDRYVLSGPVSAMTDLPARCAALGFKGKILSTNRAFHSALMDEILDGLTEVMRAMTVTGVHRAGTWFSTVTGKVSDTSVLLDPGYWVRQAREPVRYADAAKLLGDGLRMEIGAGADLTSLTDDSIAVATQGRSTVGEVHQYLTALGTAWVHGATLDWETIGPKRSRVSLPPHPMGGNDHGSLTLARSEARATHTTDTPVLAELRPHKTTIENVLSSVLGCSAIDGSFLALGGDSLKAVQVVGRMRDELGVDVTMTDLLAADSLGALARKLSEENKTEVDVLAALESALLDVGEEA